MNLSIIIPVYNEVRTINQIINKVLNVKTRYKEIIIVDDYSTDGTKKFYITIVIRVKVHV